MKRLLAFFKNRFAVMALALFASISVFAEDKTYDTQAITDNVTDMGNALKAGIDAMVTAISPIAVAILISAMVLGLLVLSIRWLFRIAKTSAK